MKFKKAQGLSMNVIIIAALALIVLVVLVFIFSDKLSMFGKGVSKCSGECSGNLNINSGSEICSNVNPKGTYTYNPGRVCFGTNGERTNQACCIQVIKP